MQNKRRNPDGTFGKGHDFSKGPHRRMNAAYRDAIRGAVSADDLARVFKTLYAKAREGDTSAARLLADHLLGRPTIPPDTESPTPFDVRQMAPMIRQLLGVDLPEGADLPDMTG